jgi:hypothetical protein
LDDDGNVIDQQGGGPNPSPSPPIAPASTPVPLLGNIAHSRTDTRFRSGTISHSGPGTGSHSISSGRGQCVLPRRPHLQVPRRPRQGLRLGGYEARSCGTTSTTVSGSIAQRRVMSASETINKVRMMVSNMDKAGRR